MKFKLVTVMVASCVLAGMPAMASQQTPPDNTRVNARDRSATQPTADQAKNNKSDRQIMQDIRKSVMDDKDLSTYAHNVKIISQNGKVTLKGVVRSEDERKTVRSKADEVAGAANVTDSLSIKPKAN